MPELETITELEVLKRDVLRHADHHRATCPGESCNMSLWTLKRVAELAGIEFTPEESRRFI